MDQTDLPGSAKALYERRYCARGQAENRIKEAQLDMFGRRASCHRFQGNQLRVLLAGLAYTLTINLRRLGLQGTELANACVATIRTRLLKIGTAILRNTRRPPDEACLLHCGTRTGPLNFIQCCPRHADKQRGQGH